MKRPTIRVFCILLACSALVWLLGFGYSRYRHHMDAEQCAASLHEIGRAVLLYANEHSGRWPDSLATLLRTEELNPQVFVCLDSDDTAAPGDDSTARAT